MGPPRRVFGLHYAEVTADNLVAIDLEGQLREGTSGQVNRAGIGKHLGLLHEIDDQLDLVRPVTAWQKRALEAIEIPETVHEAGISARDKVISELEIKDHRDHVLDDWM